MVAPDDAEVAAGACAGGGRRSGPRQCGVRHGCGNAPGGGAARLPQLLSCRHPTRAQPPSTRPPSPVPLLSVPSLPPSLPPEQTRSRTSLRSTLRARVRRTCSSPRRTRSRAPCTASSRSCWRYGWYRGGSLRVVGVVVGASCTPERAAVSHQRERRKSFTPTRGPAAPSPARRCCRAPRTTSGRATR